jgi:hypothetical protein
MTANEFICQACTFKNEFKENDLTSARCAMCDEKNEVIADMIYAGMMQNKYQPNQASAGKIRVCSNCYTVMPKYGTMCTNVCLNGKVMEVEESRVRELQAS